MAYSKAFLFSVGKEPGRPKQTGQVCEFGGAPNSVEQEQKSFDSVLSCTCTSNPILTMKFILKNHITEGRGRATSSLFAI
jgi:hypothetical protein